MRWNFRSSPENNAKWMDNFSDMSPIITELLSQRGIQTKAEAQSFLSPDLNELHSPATLDSIDIASNRVHEAIHHNEKILIYGDYDADGVSSTTVMLETLEELGANCDYYIPNRFTEGYGPNEQAFRKAYESGFSLIITVDTGIAALHEAEVARELGIDLIITDHHEVQDQLPDAYAIIHPKCSNDYPFKELAGVGVAFKFAENLLGYFPKQFLDVVAIGTIADLVPLINENRILAYYGLKVLTTSKRSGLQALKNHCKIDGNVTEEDVGFLIGPRINAVGRLQDADLAVRLLTTKNREEAEMYANQIDSLNQERQEIVKTIVSEAVEMIDPSDQGVIIVAKEGWNEGVLGIVASRLVRKYERPAIVLTVKTDTNEAKGSARSIPAFDLFHNCMKVRNLFTHFGGHAQAAGMTFPLDNLSTIQLELNKLIYDQLRPEDFTQEVEICKTLSISDITETLVNDLSRLAPFGMGNPKPVFHMNHVPAQIRQIGNGQKHIKLLFKEADHSVDGIGFQLGDLYHQIAPNTPISIIGELSINEWNGTKKMQVIVQDIKIDDWQLFDYRGKKQVDFNTLTNENEGFLAIGENMEDSSRSLPEWVHVISYNTSVPSFTNIDSLIILDLPNESDELKEIIKHTSPSKIYACYNVSDSVYMKPFPSREDFKWYYGLIRKRNTLDLNKEIHLIMNMKSWTKDRIIFMSKVFFELGFVKINKGVITCNKNPIKKDLKDSKLYQNRLRKAQLEKALYYSTYQQLKSWFQDCMAVSDGYVSEEEVRNGL